MDAVPPVSWRLRTGLTSGLQTSWKLIKYVIPLYVAVDLLKGTPVIELLGRWFAPMMALFGLPGEAALAFVAAFLLNLYAALAIMAPLDLTPWQITQCGLMMGIAHNLLVEGAVLGSTGTRGGLLTLSRLAIAAGAGLILHLLHRLGGG
ncbi:MAG: nucleoside recognition protein [Desulfuromonadales bacterium]|nr:nucleoside recognition protein [Desulfuromonadales bacterium]